MISDSITSDIVTHGGWYGTNCIDIVPHGIDIVSYGSDIVPHGEGYTNGE